MTRSTKIAATVAMAALVLVASIVTVAVYYLVNFQQGAKLAQDGYLAAFRGDHDRAIAQLSQALGRKLTNYQLLFVYLNRGGAYNSKWLFEEAIRDYTKAIRLNPNLPDGYVGRGFAYQRKGEAEKAIVDLTEAIRLDPNSATAHYNRGLIFFQKNEIDRAIADADEAVRCNPTSADALVARGQCYLAKNDLNRALANFDGAIAVEPTNPTGYVNRANLYAAKGDREKQQRDYQQALRLNPNIDRNVPRDASRLGKSASEVFQEAERAYEAGEFDHAIELNNNLMAMSISSEQVSPVLINRGNAYHAKGDLDRALADYEKAIAFDPKNAGAHVDRALVLKKKGRLKEAMDAYGEAIRINPQMWQAYINRAYDLGEKDNFTGALKDLAEVEKLNPTYAPVYLARAAIYDRKGAIDQALADCNRAIQFDPNLAEAYLIRATTHSHKRDYAKAAQDIEAAAHLKPKHLDEVLNSLAWLQATCPNEPVRNGKAAVETATRACELTNWKNADFIDSLAAAYAETRDFDRAIKFQKQALEMTDPSQRGQKGTKKRLKLYEQHKPYREEPKE